MCSYLERQLNVDPSTVRDFENRVHHDFAGSGPYPTIVLPQTIPPAYPLSARGSLSKGAPVIPSPSIACPSIAYPSSPPRYLRGFPLCLDFTCVVGVTSNASRCACPGLVKVALAESSLEAPVISHMEPPHHLRNRRPSRRLLLPQPFLPQKPTLMVNLRT